MNYQPQVVAIILARLGSRRFPGKVLTPLAGKPLLLHVVDAARTASTVDRVVVATTQLKRDDDLVAVAEEAGVDVFRGSEQDVLARFAGAISYSSGEVGVRLTVDNPLMTGGLIDLVVRRHLASGADYTCNFLQQTLPDGLEVEVIPRHIIEHLLHCATTPDEREHVTWYIRTYKEEFHIENVAIDTGEVGWEGLSLSIDAPEDLDRVEILFEKWKEILARVA